ncbi:HlyD family efflux transporter periplasmic adaptor subunit [Leptotrichia sp. oral taxon 417]|uniref:efflux RND transporter periplasmic adaptor subunit n=1 Tax=Leptotrichia sp. oral taxon 417 TaxID=712365 RepID=UPI0015BE65F0|nr:HlyD family efflux transporter periplasmic adaptor subunit [Leptotrichia sp. oral taxon 417]NWO26523.1 HlyD family efflux transporter periplasmic adaptor subunit [Leptotrichia sp. oral taxon 417]
MKKKDELIWLMPTIFIFIILFMIKFCTPKINKKYIVSKVKRENLELFVDMKGTVVANNVAKIGLDVNLSVDNVYFKAGDFVKKGDIIVKFSDYQKSDISEKRALLAVKNVQLRNLEKQQKLGADVNQKIQEVKGEINGLELEVKDEMKNAVLVQRTVRSPFDGYIVKINAVKGGIVNKNEPVVVLAKKNDLKIISESMTDEKIKNLSIGNMAEVSLFRRKNKKAGEEKTLEELVEIKNDKGKEGFQNRDNKGNLDLFSERKVIEAELFKINKVVNMNVLEFLPISFKDLFLNEQVDIRVIYRKKENVLTVSKKAIIFKNQKSYIYLIDKNNLVREREVFVGMDNGEKIEIFGMNIEEGMEIVENPDDKITNNVIVERRNIQDEEIEKKKRIEKLENENEKIGNKMDENEREIIRLKKK